MAATNRIRPDCVTDLNGEPVQNSLVSFTISHGNGHFADGSLTTTVSTNPQGRASVHLIAGPNAGPQQIQADFANNTATPAVFLGEVVQTSEDISTSVSGLVVDQNLRALPNVLVHVGGQQARTGSDGRFVVNNVASGPHQLLELIGRNQNCSKPE